MAAAFRQFEKAFELYREAATDGEVWMDMLERRNLLSHTYDEKTFEEAFVLAQGPFYEAIASLAEKLAREA